MLFVGGYGFVIVIQMFFVIFDGFGAVGVRIEIERAVNELKFAYLHMTEQLISFEFVHRLTSHPLALP
jgi:hypothetical protein